MEASEPPNLDSLFRPAKYTLLPKFCLGAEYIAQVGPAGVLFIGTLGLAYDEGRHRRKHRLEGGWFALPDKHIQLSWGGTTTHAIRKARRRVLEARPRILEYRQGHSGQPSEYRFRQLTEEDALEIEDHYVGLPPRRAKGPDTDLASRSNDTLARALEYRDLGLSVIPTQGKQPRVKWKPYQDKRATADQIVKWLKKWPRSNIAIITGVISGIVVIDVDGELDVGIRLLAEAGVELPETTTVATNRGFHLYFSYAGAPLKNRTWLVDDETTHVDVRAEGGYVIAPPSIHPNGTLYRFERELQALAPLPQSFVDLLRSSKDVRRPVPPLDGATDGRSASPTSSGHVDVAALLARTDIVEVVQGAGVELRREGPDAYRGSCPFHQDQTPSLVVTPSKGLYHCFGCAKAGNAIQFLAAINGIPFVQALRMLEGGDRWRRVGDGLG